MDVVLGVHRKIKIHDVRNAVHVDAARGDVGGDKDADDAGFEIVQRAQTLILGAVGMQRARLDSGAFEFARDFIRSVFGAGENKDAVEFRILQQMGEQRGFEMFGNFVNQLRDRLRRVRATSDLHDLRCVLELVSQLLDLFGERGGKHQRLPALR